MTPTTSKSPPSCASAATADARLTMWDRTISPAQRHLCGALSIHYPLTTIHLLLHLCRPVLHERQLLRHSRAGHDRQELLSIPRRCEFPAQPAHRQRKQVLAAAYLKRRSRSIPRRRGDPRKIEVINFLAIRTPLRIGSLSG